MSRPVRPKSSLTTLVGLLVRSAVICSALGGCYSTGDGSPPPPNRVYYPVGLAITPVADQPGAHPHLIVVNSDFDLQYNAGTLVSLNLDVLRQYVPQSCEVDADCEPRGLSHCDRAAYVCVASPESNPCGDPSNERTPAEQLMYPGHCKPVPLEVSAEVTERGSSGETLTSTLPLVTQSVQIGAFATDVLYRSHPRVPGSGRIFVPVRGDATLHWADVGPDGRVACGQENNGGACDDLHRAGNDPEQENTRDLRLGAEPFGIAASWNGEAIMVTNQTSGAASLFVNPWLNQENDAGPKLEFRLEQLSSRPVGVTAVPPPARILAQPAVRNGYAPAFLVTFRNTPEVVLVRYYSDSEYVGRQAGSPENVASPSRPFVTRLATAFTSPNSPGTDSRGIVADDSSRRELEQRCFAAAGLTGSCLSDYGVNGKESCVEQAGDAGGALDTCLTRASQQPLDFFLASRSPASLLVGSSGVTNDQIGNNEIPSFYDSIPLTVGPSRVVTGEVIVGGDAQVIADGQEDTLTRERRVFVVSFDSRRVFIYDPVRRRLDAEVTTGRGPYAISVDSKHGHLYIGQFTDSFISVVSLDRRHPRTYAQVLATIGAPSAPRTSK